MIPTDMHEKIHQGRNVKRIREILGIKQDALALDLNLSQQAISQLEQKESIDPALLEEISKVLKVPVEAIKNFKEENTINIFSNTYQDNSSILGTYNFNPLEKLMETIDENKKLYQNLLKEKDEKIALLEKMLDKK